MKMFVNGLSAVALIAALVVPATALAQEFRQDRKVDQREETRSQWQKLAIAGAAVGLLGQLNRDKAISYLGAAGSLYSLYRANEDTKKIDNLERRHFDGSRFDRRVEYIPVKENDHERYEPQYRERNWNRDHLNHDWRRDERSHRDSEPNFGRDDHRNDRSDDHHDRDHR